MIRKASPSSGRFTEELIKFLTERRYSFTASAEREIARNVKENPSYIGLDYDTELKSIAKFDKKKTFVLPDRNIISVGAGHFHCAEILYQLGFIDQESSRIHDTSFQNVIKCDVDAREDLYDNVVLFSPQRRSSCQHVVKLYLCRQRECVSSFVFSHHTH